MIARIISGVECANRILLDLTERVATLDFVPGLAMIVLGSDVPSHLYVIEKESKAETVGIRSRTHWLPVSTPQDELLCLIRRLNEDELVDGILVQLPLPAHISECSVFNAIATEKDVDCLSVFNTGLLSFPDEQRLLVPCTPRGCMVLLEEVYSNLSGLEAVILGRSRIVGRPLMQLLLRANCTVTVAHSKSKNLPDVCKRADILIVAVGSPQCVQADWIKPGATVIDVGVNRVSESANGGVSIVGDVDFANVRFVAGAITPVPGGVGPLTVSMLLANTLAVALSRRGLSVT